MLHLIDQGLEAFLRSEVPLAKDQIDVSFDAPDRDWAARTTRPTVDLFLWDVRLATQELAAGVEVYREEDGTVHRARPKPRIDLRYLVTAWTADVRDEHQLLGSVLATLFAHGELPEAHLPETYAKVRPLPRVAVAYPSGRDSGDFWSALGGRLKPGLDLVVTATLDVALVHQVGPPVVRYEVQVDDRFADAQSTRVLVGDLKTGVVTHGDERVKGKATKRKR